MDINISATRRVPGTKSDLNVMRKRGFIPAIIYSDGEPTINITINKHDFLKEYRRTIGELVLFNLILNGSEYRTILKEKQIDPVTREIIHIDFLRVAKDRSIVVNVPLRFEGTPVGVEAGGTLEVVIREIQIDCLPDDLPEDIEIDVSELEIGQSIRVADIRRDDMELMIADDVTIAVVHPPREEVEEELEVEEIEIEDEEITEED